MFGTEAARPSRAPGTTPRSGLHGPDRGVRKSKGLPLALASSYAVVSCEFVPLAWRRTSFAVATYLYVRAGEGNAFTWADVELDRRVVHIHSKRRPRDRRLEADEDERGASSADRARASSAPSGDAQGDEREGEGARHRLDRSQALAPATLTMPQARRQSTPRRPHDERRHAEGDDVLISARPASR